MPVIELPNYRSIKNQTWMDLLNLVKNELDLKIDIEFPKVSTSQGDMLNYEGDYRILITTSTNCVFKILDVKPNDYSYIKHNYFFLSNPNGVYPQLFESLTKRRPQVSCADLIDLIILFSKDFNKIDRLNNVNSVKVNVDDVCLGDIVFAYSFSTNELYENVRVIYKDINPVNYIPYWIVLPKYMDFENFKKVDVVGKSMEELKRGIQQHYQQLVDNL